MNYKKLGYRQRHLLTFLKNHGQDGRRFYISRDRETRRAALTLEKRGLIRIVDNATECWMVAAAFSPRNIPDWIGSARGVTL